MGIRGKERTPRFRRTKKEIKAGLTIRQAKKIREKRASRDATLSEKIEMVELLMPRLDLDYKSPYKDFFIYKKYKYSYAKTKEVLARIRKNAEKEANKDPLLI
jgi:hypothetical protein